MIEINRTKIMENRQNLLFGEFQCLSNKIKIFRNIMDTCFLSDPLSYSRIIKYYLQFDESNNVKYQYSTISIFVKPWISGELVLKNYLVILRNKYRSDFYKSGFLEEQSFIFKCYSVFEDDNENNNLTIIQMFKNLLWKCLYDWN